MWQLLLSVALADQTPAYPRWPDQWHADFVEVNKLPGTFSAHNTTGTFHYDYTDKIYAIARANGRYDRYCGLNGSKAFENTPCT
mmetsp:Transcript_33373/g.6040  ORF Transcript_33373/g.6040 Transcript_33373/m.6040 type:complete len:84 (-) Transcript_33373:429-680(-)